MTKALLPLAALAALSALAACRTPKTAPPDYDSVRQRAGQSDQELDRPK